MPKEIIDSMYAGRTASDGVPLEPTYAHVGWSREAEHVELGVVNPMAAAAVVAPGGGRAPSEIAYPAAEGTHDPCTGWFMQLDRAGINRLIRVLRRARDQAFGEDA